MEYDLGFLLHFTDQEMRLFLDPFFVCLFISIFLDSVGPEKAIVIANHRETASFVTVFFSCNSCPVLMFYRNVVRAYALSPLNAVVCAAGLLLGGQFSSRAGASDFCYISVCRLKESKLNLLSTHCAQCNRSWFPTHSVVISKGVVSLLVV